MGQLSPDYAVAILGFLILMYCTDEITTQRFYSFVLAICSCASYLTSPFFHLSTCKMGHNNSIYLPKLERELSNLCKIQTSFFSICPVSFNLITQDQATSLGGTDQGTLSDDAAALRTITGVLWHYCLACLWSPILFSFGIAHHCCEINRITILWHITISRHCIKQYSTAKTTL